MKYAIPIRSHRVRPPRPCSRVAPRRPTPPPYPAGPFTPSRKDIELVAGTRFHGRRPPFHLSLRPTAGPLNLIQNP
jgi:hypothetical protein